MRAAVLRTASAERACWAACLLQLVKQPSRAWPSQLTWGRPTASFLTETVSQLSLSPCPPCCPFSPPTGARDTSVPALSTHAGPGRDGRCACHLRLRADFSANLTLGEQEHKPLWAPGPADSTRLSHKSHEEGNHAIFLTHTQREVHRTKRTLLEDRQAASLKGGWGVQGTTGGRTAAA